MHLTIRDLSKAQANGARALTGVSLTVPAGIFGLLGPGGAGKTTLLRILATLQEADAGSAKLGNLDVFRQPDELRRTLGYLPQLPGALPNVSAQDLLDHFALLRGHARHGERRALVEALLQQAGLWEARRQRLGGYPAGMRQRFAVAVALLGNPRLLLLDEPAAGLDPEERTRLLELLAKLGEDRIVLIATRVAEDVRERCARMAIIARGRILLEGAPPPDLERVYSSAIAGHSGRPGDPGSVAA